MSSAYRDDLEAALRRAEVLEREVAALRERNQNLTAKLAGGDTTEVTTNADRLAAAIAREQQEERMRDEANLDERAARERAKAERHASHQPSPEERRKAMMLSGVAMVIRVVIALVLAWAVLATRAHR